MAAKVRQMLSNDFKSSPFCKTGLIENRFALRAKSFGGNGGGIVTRPAAESVEGLGEFALNRENGFLGSRREGVSSTVNSDGWAFVHG
jgi:hypothetical protein